MASSSVTAAVNLHANGTAKPGRVSMTFSQTIIPEEISV
jgi:hypothetical protein